MVARPVRPVYSLSCRFGAEHTASTPAVDIRSRDLLVLEVAAMRTASENFVAIARREGTRPRRHAVQKSA
jgi:hypothetical protein